MKHAIVTGGSSGLGAAVVFELARHGYNVVDWSLETGVDVACDAMVQLKGSELLVKEQVERIDLLVNCAGYNYLSAIEDFSMDRWDRVMAINVRAPMLLVKTLYPLLHGGTVLNIVSNAARVPMTHSAAYNASKAALEMLTRQMAHELWPAITCTVFGVSPNKMHSTRMTKSTDKRVAKLRDWTPEQARDYQLRKLAIGEETDPHTVAEFIGFLLSTKQRHRYLHGCILEYGR